MGKKYIKTSTCASILRLYVEAAERPTGIGTGSYCNQAYLKPPIHRDVMENILSDMIAETSGDDMEHDKCQELLARVAKGRAYNYS